MQLRRASEFLLSGAFLLILFGVPGVQTAVELARGERVRATDVIRNTPTAPNLRRYEKTLEDRSVLNQWSRPVTQAGLFEVFGDVGSKAVAGRDGWLFYRPDLRYLVAPDAPETAAGNSRWLQPTAVSTHQESVRRAILRFRDQLQQRGIRLVVVPVPGKPGVYPDQVTRRLVGAAATVNSPTERLIERLRDDGVVVANLFALFRHARPKDGGGALYLKTDTHWTPQGADLAARTVAEQVRTMGADLGPAVPFETRRVLVQRRGDILEMAQVPGLDRRHTAETVECEQVLDPALGPLVPTPSDRPGCYKYPAQRSSVLVLGDSFCRIYQSPEPRSLGEVPGAEPADGGGKRLLPGSAGFVSRLALALGAPVDAIVSDGGASTDVRQKLGTNPEILEGKTLVVWEFVERDIGLGRAGWEDVPLPALLGTNSSAGPQGASHSAAAPAPLFP